MDESRESSPETLVQWVRRRPAMAALVLACLLAMVVASLWYLGGGGTSGPQRIDRSPWEGRNAPGGPKQAKPPGK